MSDKTVWLLRGPHGAPGWFKLEADFRAELVDVLLFDRDRWALVQAAEPPNQYDDMTPEVPRDGLYLDQHGRPCYILGAREVHSARAVVKELGDEADALMQKLGDADLVLERLGRAY